MIENPLRTAGPMDLHTTSNTTVTHTGERKKYTRMLPLSTIEWEVAMKFVSPHAVIGITVTETLPIEKEGALNYVIQ